MRERLQQFGGFLAGMVIPNIGAFIAWGLITALFIPTGWIPNENFAKLVGPMILYLLPILIGYTGGKMIHGHRGGVVGAAATMGVVVGTDIPMFLGAMIMGPLGGWATQKIDEMLEDKVGVGFEMLVNNFSAGILGLILALLGFVAIGPVVQAFSEGARAVVDALINARLLPLAAIIIEPAKVLFLNNALNHGVLSPLGVAAAADTGRAIHFLLETNPGPGLGLLLAFYVAGKRHAERICARLDDHPLPRRHSRDLLPVCPCPPNHDFGDDCRWLQREPLVRHQQRRSGRYTFAWIDFCLPGRHPARTTL